MTSDKLSTIMEEIHSYAARGDWWAIDIMFTEVDFGKDTTESLAYLRSCYMMGHMLMDYEGALLKTYKVFSERLGRQKAASLLKGLPIPTHVLLVLK